MGIFRPNVEKLKKKGNIKGLVKALKYQELSVCQEAADALRMLEWKPANLEEKAYFLMATGKWNEISKIGQSAVKPLIQALSNKDRSVRRNATVALGDIKDPETVHFVMRGLDDKYEDVRREAINALSKLGLPAVKPLVQTLKYGKYGGHFSSYAASEALGKIGAPAVEPLIQTIKKVKTEVKRLLLDDEEREDLLEREDLIDRLKETLGEIVDTKATEYFVKALKDKDIRREAIIALGNIGDAKAVEPLIEALKYEDQYLQKGAYARREGIVANALSKIGESSVTPLIQALKHNDKEIRIGAITALAKIGNKRAVNPLIHALKDEDKDVQSKAAFALGQICHPSSIQPLIEALKNSSSKVQVKCATALKKFKNSSAKKALKEYENKKKQAKRRENSYFFDICFFCDYDSYKMVKFFNVNVDVDRRIYVRSIDEPFEITRVKGGYVAEIHARMTIRVAHRVIDEMQYWRLSTIATDKSILDKFQRYGATIRIS